MAKQQKEDIKQQEAMMNKQQFLLPKPVRMFSYVFFSAVFIAVVIGWFISQY